ncbi:unnamed protein product [Coregonus sp. 'balchen']|nr:unnamed protein product [Coregonus sp. 'balchen']
MGNQRRIEWICRKLISSDADGAIQRAGRFRVENGSSDEMTDYTPGTWRRTDVHLENPEYHTRWFFKYFLGKVHQNYIGTDAEKNPFYLSVVLSDQNNQRVPQYRAILWRKTGTLKISLPYSPTKTLSVKSILSAMNLDRFEKGPREILNPEIQKDLLVLEEQEGSVNFKFGVLYAKDGQLTDDEMFSNETGSQSFDKFLNLLGDTISLQGWAGYRGGLDTKNDTTGMNSIYTVERKRHIGNDIVTIVFQEGEDASPSFKPSMIRSHFTHIFALVRYNSQNDSYRLKIFSEESVPLFGPPLPSPPVFTDHQEFRDFLLVKLINGEKATLETPTFAQKRQRTLDMLIRSLYQDLIPDLHKPWESQSFCSTFPYETVCADSWGQSLLVATEAAGVMMIDDAQVLPPVQVFDKTMVVKQIHVVEPQDLLITRADKGCHLYSINTHHGSELRIVAAIRNKLLLITRKQPRLDTLTAATDSPVDQFQYIREICLCDPPVVMALVDGPTGENDNMICVAYKHQFDLINESTGDAYRLHHVDANRKVCLFNGSTPMIQSNASDLHFSWNQMPNAIVCAFPYILAFTTDSIEIRLVVNGNLVYTAVVPELQLTASRSDIYFVSSAPVNSASNCSSRDTSSQSSPQTPTGYEMPVFPSPLGDGETQCKHIFKIPLSNLVGRSIERPLKSPLVNKEPSSKPDSSKPDSRKPDSSKSESSKPDSCKPDRSKPESSKPDSSKPDSSKPDSSKPDRKMSRKTTEEETKALTSTSSDRVGSESADTDSDIQWHCSSSSEAEPEKVVLREESPPLASPFTLSTSFEEDVLDLK